MDGIGRSRTLVRAVAPCLSVFCCSLSVLFPVHPSDCLSVLFPLPSVLYPAYLSVCLSVCLVPDLSACLSCSLSSYLYFLFPVYLVRCLSVCLSCSSSVCLVPYPSVCLVPSFHVCMSGSLSSCLYVLFAFLLVVCLSVCLVPSCLPICMSCSLFVYLVHRLFVCPFVTLDGGSDFILDLLVTPKDCEPQGKMTADCVIRFIPFTIDRA